MTWRRRLWRLARGCLLVGLAAVGAVWIAVVAVPFPPEVLAPGSVESRRFQDRHGRPLREALSDAEGRGVWRPLAELGPWAGPAFIAIEDRRFEAHAGVDLRGVARAARDNLRAGRVVAGGSTITQQVVQLVLPQPRSLWGKVKEAIWALRLERAVDKAGILEQYVNRAPFGHGTIGLEAAARLYLGRPARSLTLAQTALLVGIPRAPSRNNPFTDLPRARARQREVLAKMRATGAIDDATLAEALAEPIAIQPRDAVFAAPHFTAWALTQDATPGDVRTTLDLDLQHAVEDAIASTLPALRDRAVRHAAVVVLENRTGDVLAWAGSPDFFDADQGQVDMVVGLRQPGSTLKPFVYGLGLEAGFTAASHLPDLPLYFPTGLGDYRPRNYDRTFHGWVRLREALANSYNVPAVWMAHQLDPGVILDRLRGVGFVSLDRPATFYGLGLALGNGEVRLLELANAYRALANGGLASPPRWRLDAEPGAPTRVMPAGVAHLLTDILADPVARAPAFGRYSPLELPFPAAAKTGTSTDFTDNWTVGFTTAVTVAVWVGNFDGRPMEGVSGITGAGRLWHRVMLHAARRHPAGELSHVGLRRATLCLDDVPQAACTRPFEEWFLAGDEAPAVATPPAARLRVTFPGDGDRFGRDADTPAEFAQLRLRAEAPAGVERLVFAVDGVAGEPVGRPFQRWWPLAPGPHTVQVWEAGRPDRPSAVVRFVVDGKAPTGGDGGPAPGR
ncbi:MAG: penicillin-binding protein 1C [Myxococcales bacterium]|nr:penicillin-binding protein 1C [Myxococcales bacterium]